MGWNLREITAYHPPLEILHSLPETFEQSSVSWPWLIYWAPPTSGTSPWPTAPDIHSALATTASTSLVPSSSTTGPLHSYSHPLPAMPSPDLFVSSSFSFTSQPLPRTALSDHTDSYYHTVLYQFSKHFFQAISLWFFSACVPSRMEALESRGFSFCFQLCHMHLNADDP